MIRVFIREWLIMLSIFFLFWLNCGSKADTSKKGEKIRVKTAKIQHKRITKSIHTSGRLSSKAEMKLSFKVAGIIRFIFVDEGQKVKRGQKLAELDLSEIKAQVNQAQSAFDKAKRDVERVKKLYADNVVPLEQLQNAETGYEIAKSNLNVAEFNLRYSTIYAPTDGKVLKRFAEVNELISPGVPIFYFGTSGQEWIVRVGITDKEILNLQLGDSAVVIFDTYPGIEFLAQVAEIAETADLMSGTFEVELKVNQGKYKLISGFVAKVTIFPSIKQNYSIIPIEALIEGDSNHGFVYILSDDQNKVNKIPIQIGIILEKEIAVISGLEHVDKVVTDGAAYLKDGSVVEIVDEF
jgi:multidrug efflux system membrane fusion protein